MDKGLASQAAEIMHHQLQEGTVLQNLPDSLRPHSRADGYEIQAMLENQKGNNIQIGFTQNLTETHKYLNQKFKTKFTLLSQEKYK